jgi:holo-[acyl-carrier protein] synthase
LDAIEIHRIEETITRQGARFLQRVYTAYEIELAPAHAGRFAFFAGRFAAKEAVLKALGTGWAGGIAFTDVEVRRRPGGAPHVTLHGLALRRAAEIGVSEVHVSITHTRSDAQAIAFLS